MTSQTRICMLLSEDHLRHPIVRRQVRTLTRAGASLTVIDQGPGAAPPPIAGYTSLRVQPVSFQLIARVVWKVLRRVDPDGIGELWWTSIHFAEVLLTSVRYTLAAVRANADFYQAHDLNTLLPAVVAGYLRHAPVIYDAHELYTEQGDPTRLRNRIERRIERWLMPAVAQVIVPNRARARFLAERCSLRRPPVVVENCAPLKSIPRTRALHERLGLPAHTRVVLYHGALIEGRSLGQLIVSAREFSPDTVLVLVGEQGTYFHEVLAPLVQKDDLAGKVFCLPYVDSDVVTTYLGSATVGVVIYRNINLNNYLCAPTKLYEYIMAEVPVVVSAFPSMLELLAEYPVGHTFDPEDPSSIARAVNAVLADRPDLSEPFARARQRYTWEIEGNKLLALFGLAKATDAQETEAMTSTAVAG